MVPYRARSIAWLLMAGVFAGGMAGCNAAPRTVLEQLSEARRLTAELHVQFTTATDAANRAVMADTDDSAAAFAKEACENSLRALQAALAQRGFGGHR